MRRRHLDTTVFVFPKHVILKRENNGHLCKSQTTPNNLQNENCLSTGYDMLVFCMEGGSNLGQLGGSMWLWSANQLVLWDFYFFSFIFLKEGILHVTTLETWQNQYWRWTWFHWQMTHVEFANDVVHLHNMNDNRIPPNNTRLGSIYSSIMEPRSTPSSTLFLTIIYYFIMIRNC